MGSKGVKVIVLDDSEMKMRAAKDPRSSGKQNKRWVDGLKKHPVTAKVFPRMAPTC